MAPTSLNLGTVGRMLRSPPTRRIPVGAWWTLSFALAIGLVGPHPGLHAAPDLRRSLLFEHAFELIKDRYVDEQKVSDELMFEGAVRGMVEMLDRHSAYLDAKTKREMREDTAGSFGGVGIEISVERGRLVVVAPIEDTPAFRAGIQPGDHVLSIDGASTEGYSIDQAIDKLRGPVGGKVVLGLEREGLEDALDLTLARDVIKIETVKSFLLKEGTGYLRIKSFAETTSDDVKKGLEGLIRQGARSLVLDLRGNPGGLLDAAITVASQFIPAGKPIVSTRGRHAEMNSENFSLGGGWMDPDRPVIVLVNKGSASASEIVTGALKDHHRGMVVGAKTYGKASVQRIFDLPGGAGIKLTTAHYYTPSGALIHEKGIEPDVTVPDRLPGKLYADLMRKEAIVGFADEWVKVQREPGRTWEISPELIRKFTAYAGKTFKLTWGEEEWKRDEAVILRLLKYELTRKTKNRDAADLLILQENDEAIKKALDILKLATMKAGDKPEGQK